MPPLAPENQECATEVNQPSEPFKQSEGSAFDASQAPRPNSPIGGGADQLPFGLTEEVLAFFDRPHVPREVWGP